MWKKVLAIVGVVLVWLPIGFMLLTGIFTTIRSGQLHGDYLMPMELYPLTLAGAVLLVVLALILKQRRLLLVLGLTLPILFGLLTIGSAQLMGLDSGLYEPTGWRLAIMLTFIALFILAVIADGIFGILLARDLRRPAQPG